MHAPPYSTLLPLALPPESLRNSLVLLVVDWEDPWAFLDNLRDWLKMLQNYAEQLVGVHSNASRTSTGSNPASHLELACERRETEAFTRVRRTGSCVQRLTGTSCPNTLNLHQSKRSSAVTSSCLAGKE